MEPARAATAGATPRLRRSFRPEPIDLHNVEDGAGLAAWTSRGSARPMTGGRPATADAGRDELLAMLEEEKARRAKAEHAVTTIGFHLKGVKVEHATVRRALQERTDQTKKVERDVRMQTVVFRQKQEEQKQKSAGLQKELVEAQKAIAVLTLPPRQVAKQDAPPASRPPSSGAGQAPSQAVDLLRQSLLDLLSTGGATTWTPRPAAQGAFPGRAPAAAAPLVGQAPSDAPAAAVAAEAPPPVAKQQGGAAAEEAPPPPGASAQGDGAAQKRTTALEVAAGDAGAQPSARARERSGRKTASARPRAGSLTSARSAAAPALSLRAKAASAGAAVAAAAVSPEPSSIAAALRLELPALRSTAGEGAKHSYGDAWGYDAVLDLVKKGTGRAKSKMAVLDGVYGAGSGRSSTRRLAAPAAATVSRVASLPLLGGASGRGLPAAASAMPAAQLDTQVGLPKRLALVC